MSWLTLFSVAKPFTDPRIATIQRNALASWARLPEVEILLMGEEEGASEAAAEVGARHIRDVKLNDRGTPLVSSMIDLARQHSRSALLGIINADMIIMRDLLDAGEIVRARLCNFVVIGRRWDLELTDPLDFSDGWQDRLRRMVRERGILHRPAGSDFFLFPRECYEDVPDFAVGRAGWDNWMIYNARRRHWAVVDCTPSVMAVHQNHDYGHLPGGQPHYGMPESGENIRLAGGEAAIRYTVLDATHLLTNGELVHPRPSYDRLLRGLELALRRVFSFLPAAMIEEVSRPKRWRKRFLRLVGVNAGKPRTGDRAEEPQRR